MHRPDRVVMLAVAAISIAACSSSDIDADEPIGEQMTDADRAEFTDGMAASALGAAMTRSEIECVADSLLESGVTPAEMLDAPTDVDGPGAAAFADAIVACLDPDADVDAPFDGAFGDDLRDSLGSAGFSDTEIDCLFERFTAAGFDARDLALADFVPTPGVAAARDDALEVCL